METGLLCLDLEVTNEGSNSEKYGSKVHEVEKPKGLFRLRPTRPCTFLS